jgi:hypothetical protein
MTRCRGILVVHDDGSPAGCTALPCPGPEVRRHAVVVHCHSYGPCAACDEVLLAKTA